MTNRLKPIPFLILLCALSACARVEPEPVRLRHFGDIAPGVLGYTFEDASPLIVARERIARAPQRDYRAIEREIIALLREPATFGARQFLLHQLKIVGSDECVPYLEFLLADPRLAPDARIALEAIRTPEASRALRRALEELRGPPLIGVIASAGNRRDSRAINALRLLASGRDPQLAETALHALGNIGGRRALIFLESTRVPPELEPARWDALLRAAHSMETGGVQHARRVYRGLFAPQYPTPVRIAALTGLARIERRRALPLLQRSLTMDEPPVAETAANLLQIMPGGEPTSVLVAALDAPATPTQFLAVKALETRGDPYAAAAVAPLMASDSEPIRIAAIKATGAMRNAAPVPSLIAKLTPNSGEARLAQRALTVLDHGQVNDLLVSALLTTDTLRQRRLIEILEARNALAATDALSALIESPDAAVRRAAWQALGAVAPPSITYIMTEKMLASGEAERAHAQRAIGSMIDRAVHLEGDTGPLDRLMTIYKGAVVTEKVSLLRVLGPLRYGFSHRLLRRELESPHRELRAEAVRQIADWDNDHAATDMLWLAKTAETDELRRLSLRSYLRLADNNYTLRPPEKNAAMFDAAKPLVKDREMKLALLSGYQKLLPKDGIERARPFLEDEEVVNEAAAALIVLAESYGVREKEAARAALEQAADSSPDPDIKKRARDAIKTLNEPKKENAS